MADESTLGLPSLAGIFVLVSLFFIWYRSRDHLLDAIPTVGYSGPILSYFSAFRYNFLDGQSMIKQGYDKSKPGLFKIPIFRRWIVFPSSAELIEDVRNAPEGILSTREPFLEILEADYTFGMLNEDMYRNHVIRSRLTRNIAAIFGQVRDEAVEAWAELIPVARDEWVKISIQPTIQQIICRTSSRIFVGTPLCLNRDYQKIALNFAENVIKLIRILSVFPKTLKPVVARIVSNIPSQVQQTMRFIKPMVKERFEKMDKLGEAWEDPPNDMLMWLMSEAKGAERSLEGLARRLLFINFASIHTTALYCAALFQHFDGFRFSKLSDFCGDVAETKHQAAITSPEHLAFGFGRNACPGRYFAVNQMKALLAHIIVTYDIKVEDYESLPRDILFTSPRSHKAEVLFRKRQK